MHFIINKKEAVLKKDTSFDYIIENRFFTGADSYTLSITFPLKGCSINQEIFGHINRKDCNLDKLLLDCDIYDRQFHATGALNIVDISDLEVKTQFLVGKSVRNFASDLDDIYINELKIGRAKCVQIGHGYADAFWFPPGDEMYEGYVCLPWVNNTSGNMQNDVFYSNLGYWRYSYGEQVPLSCQYYLLYVLEKILEQCGYSYDITNLKYSFYRFLVIFNTFPWKWDIKDWGIALPHWTVTEFLEQIELFTNGEFIVDSVLKKVTFKFNIRTIQNYKIVQLSCIDEHQVEISDKKNTNNSYMEQTNLKYAEGDHQMQKFYSCPWALGTLGAITYDCIDDLLEEVKPFLNHTGVFNQMYLYNKLLYALDIDTYFILKCFEITTKPDTKKNIHHLRLCPVNLFGPRFDDSEENAQYREISIVPVCIDHCNRTVGDCVFLECGSYGDVIDQDENQTFVANSIIDGKPEKKEEYFDKLYVGFWNGVTDVQRSAGSNPFFPIPWIDNYWVSQDNLLSFLHGDEQEDASMRLRGKVNTMAMPIYNIDQTKKFTFKFIVNNGRLPDVQSIFLIHGKKYLAEKITATFTNEGMSQLVKMVAYRLIDKPNKG